MITSLILRITYSNKIISFLGGVQGLYGFHNNLVLFSQQQYLRNSWAFSSGSSCPWHPGRAAALAD